MKTGEINTTKTLADYRSEKNDKNEKFRNNFCFNAFYKTLTRDEKSFLKQSICHECGITSTIFHNWTRFITVLPDEHTDKIEEIAAHPIFNNDKDIASIDAIK